MSFVGSTTAYPVVTPAPTDTVPLVQGGTLKQATVTALATAAAPVQSVNGETGAVTLSAADVGADAAGTAAAAVAAHEAAANPHPVYLTQAEADALYAPTGAGAGTLGWINVKSAPYSAVGDGVADDSAAIGAAVTALNALTYGGVLYFPPGIYRTAGGHVFSKRARILGDGCADYGVTGAISTVQCTSATAKLFDFQADGGAVEKVHLENGTTATAGAAVFVTDGWGFRCVDTTFEGFWIQLDFEDGAEWHVSRCKFAGPFKYGIRVRNEELPDGGDQTLSDCIFSSYQTGGADAAIYASSAGGLKVTNIKIGGGTSNIFVNGIFVDAAAATQTSILLLSNVSVENCSGTAFKARNAAGGNWDYLLINGLQTGSYVGGADVPAIDIESTSGGNAFDHIVISDCIFAGTLGATLTASAIRLVNVNGARIGPCQQHRYAALLALTNSTGVRNDNARYDTQTLTDGASIAMDNANYESFRVTLGGNRTLANPTTVYSGQVINLRVVQDGTGSRTLAYASKFKFPGGAAPVLSTAAGAKDLLSFQYDGTDDSWFIVAQKAFA